MLNTIQIIYFNIDAILNIFLYDTYTKLVCFIAFCKLFGPVTNNHNLLVFGVMFNVSYPKVYNQFNSGHVLVLVLYVMCYV